MSLRLAYVGAAAGLVPAASLRALAGGGAVFVPGGLVGDLRELVAESADPGEGRLVEVDATDEAALTDLLARARAGEVTVAVAGPQGPVLARALRARASAGPAAGSTAGASVQVLTAPDGPAFDDALLGQELVSLKRIVDVLRVECPWDREQTARDIVSYTVEEVHELADAVAGDDLAAQHGELGDLLLQVVILAMMLAEHDAGDLGSVAHDIEVKLIRRHPHIFADAVAETGAEVRERWERIKVEQEGREGIFHDVPAGAPALHFARKLQQRAAAVGFDWDSAAEAFPKIAEEHAELAEVLLGLSAAGAAGEVDGGSESETKSQLEAAERPPEASPAAQAAEHRARLTHEFGDLLFAVVNVARLAKVDPELALREAARRFERRVCSAAGIAEREGRDWSALGLAEQERYYQLAKAREESS
jgi:uncharacterized protein YabN with tetrapyrrole methylase and pyrophosphatase domain